MTTKNEKDIQQKIAEMAEQHFHAKKTKGEEAKEVVGDAVDDSIGESAERQKADEQVSQDLQQLEQTVIELQQALSQTESKVKENQDAALRFRADVDNVRRQADRDIANARKYSLEKFAVALLPILDSLEQGISTIEKDEASTSDPKYMSICEGMHMTFKMFTDMLVKFNMAVIDPLNEKFDPEWHEAIAMQPSNEAAAGTVLMVVQKGYRLNDRLLRPARVIVAKEA
jgi:molecular chaperone GrpE